MIALLKAVATLTPMVRQIVTLIVREIGKAPDPEKLARRVLDEAARLREFDERMGNRKG